MSNCNSEVFCDPTDPDVQVFVTDYGGVNPQGYVNGVPYAGDLAALVKCSDTLVDCLGRDGTYVPSLKAVERDNSGASDLNGGVADQDATLWPAGTYNEFVCLDFTINRCDPTDVRSTFQFELGHPQNLNVDPNTFSTRFTAAYSFDGGPITALSQAKRVTQLFWAGYASEQTHSVTVTIPNVTPGVHEICWYVTPDSAIPAGSFIRISQRETDVIWVE